MARREGVTAVLVAALPVLATGCDRGDDDTGARSQDVLDVAPGTARPVCMEVTEDLPPEVTKLPVIDCAEPHTHEVYATVVSTESVYPGVDALGSFDNSSGT